MIPRERDLDLSIGSIKIAVPIYSHECYYCGSETLTKNTHNTNTLLIQTVYEYMYKLQDKGLI